MWPGHYTRTVLIQVSFSVKGMPLFFFLLKSVSTPFSLAICINRVARKTAGLARIFGAYLLHAIEVAVTWLIVAMLFFILLAGKDFSFVTVPL